MPGTDPAANEANFSVQGTTDDIGTYSGQLFACTGTANSVLVTAAPPSGSGLAQVEFSDTLSLSTDTTIPIVLPVGSTLSGVVVDGNGNPVQNMSVSLVGDGSRPRNRTATRWSVDTMSWEASSTSTSGRPDVQRRLGNDSTPFAAEPAAAQLRCRAVVSTSVTPSSKRRTLRIRPHAPALPRRLLRPGRKFMHPSRHLETVLGEYVDHYNCHRPHRSRGQRPPEGDIVLSPEPETAIVKRDRLVGLIHEYSLAA
jgi:hypothetical protein